MNTPSTALHTAARIRREFLDYFRDRRDHVFVPSSPVVPHDDPTLLFANAGMNQFKDIFLGRAGGREDLRRAVNSQKCIRAGGKHNDLEDVGKDTYHHTFFEMLGNWSFGDYFKAEAIEWAWELLTDVWGLDKERMYVTVFEGLSGEDLEPDTEAEALWKEYVPAERVSRWGKKDNFWEMGETGPCGPCSEIHYDFTPDGTGGGLVNAGHPDVIEIWNLVFIQFNRGDGGALTPLPARHVDTGMGFERLVRVIQGKRSNYDTDIWQPIFRAIESHTGAHPYAGRLDDAVDTAYRVIADHIRCLSVAINDGATPSNEGRGYVLRRILRRAVRHAHQTLRVEGPLLCDLVPSVVESLGESFPELNDDPGRIVRIIRNEEESFLRTLDRGLVLFDDAAGAAGTASKSADSGAGVITAADAFRLHDTFGFPIDLTRVMAEERGITVDEEGYERLMDQARKKSRLGSTEGGTAERDVALPPEAIAGLEHLGVKPTRDEDKFAAKPLSAQVKAIWNGSDFDNVAHTGDDVIVILNRTNHYAESGGQVGDTGEISTDVFDMGTAPTRGYGGSTPRGDCIFKVRDTKSCGGFTLHVGQVVAGELRVSDKVTVKIDRNRRNSTMANHTGTHLLNHALRDVIGDDVDQRGSLVAPDRLRFDFTCAHAMSAEQLERAESQVLASIERDLAVHAEVIPLEEAMAIKGLRAVFGERYPDPVRVVSIGPPTATLRAKPKSDEWRSYSAELCGGTHLAKTSEAVTFVITQEQALAAGVRRITALTGAAARAAEIAGADLEQRMRAARELDDASLAETFDELVTQLEHLGMSVVVKQRLEPIVEELRDRMKSVAKAAGRVARGAAVDQARVIAEQASGEIVIEALSGADKETLLSAMDVIRAKRPDAATMLFAPDVDGGKVAIAATVPKKLITRGLKAGDWVRKAAQVCGGNGGGRPDMAQAGGKDPSKVDEAVTAARAFAEEMLK